MNDNLRSPKPAQSRWNSLHIGALILAAALLPAACDREPDAAEQQQMALENALKPAQRTAKNVARDGYRHPQETLQFMGIRPDMTVVELWPGGGWYSEILAPYLRAEGKLYLAQFPVDSKQAYRLKARDAQQQWLQQQDHRHAQITTLGKGHYDIAPAGSADLVLTFRNLHNWLAAGHMTQVFQAAWDALKPGGILGVVEHRAKPGTSLKVMKKSGYVTEELTLLTAREVGFHLLDESDINANPKDTADHPKGVWTLPPSLQLKEVDQDKYLAIGESDRMTLKFVKPRT